MHEQRPTDSPRVPRAVHTLHASGPGTIPLPPGRPCQRGMPRAEPRPSHKVGAGVCGREVPAQHAAREAGGRANPVGLVVAGGHVVAFKAVGEAALPGVQDPELGRPVGGQVGGPEVKPPERVGLRGCGSGQGGGCTTVTPAACRVESLGRGRRGNPHPAHCMCAASSPLQNGSGRISSSILSV